MAEIEIKSGEIGTTRVFALSMDSSAAKRLRDDPAVQTKALGAPPQGDSGIEVFPVSDLGDMGLAGYLREGIDAAPADITRDKAKLAALDGWILLLHSTAYAEDGATLKPAAALTLIGTYAQTPADAKPVALEAESAAPYTSTAPVAPPEVTQGRSTASWVALALAVVALGILITVML